MTVIVAVAQAIASLLLTIFGAGLLVGAAAAWKKEPEKEPELRRVVVVSRGVCLVNMSARDLLTVSELQVHDYEPGTAVIDLSPW